MGQSLSEPVTAKETSSCGTDTLKVGASSMQGWRIHMEDSHCIDLAFNDNKDACFFGVFDGHGGAKVAQYAGSHLSKKVASSVEYNEENDVEKALRKSFLQIDQDMLQDDELKEEMAGSTAIVCILKDNKLYCANVGDSRCIASVNGKVEQLSFDHKPSNELESKRIVAAGGWVEFNRVNGNLALSRALGDFVFKKNDSKTPEEQIVTAEPDIIIRDLTTDYEFLILACDGVWDVLSNEEVIEFVRMRIAVGMQPEIICEELMMRCLAPDCHMGGLGCDNMTVILVCFLHTSSFEELSNKCKVPHPPYDHTEQSVQCNHTDVTDLESVESF